MKSTIGAGPERGEVRQRVDLLDDDVPRAAAGEPRREEPGRQLRPAPDDVDAVDRLRGGQRRRAAT